MIQMYDANNFVRRFMETDPTGQAPRTIYNTISSQGTDMVFFVWDAPDGNKARRAIFPGYKAKRPELSGDTFAGFSMVQEVLKHSPAFQVQVEGYEADDVIATLTRHFVSKGMKVHIHSTDRDFLQLSQEAPDLVSCDSALKTGVLLRHIRHNKTLVGDTSDSIPGIPGFGEKAWADADQDLLAKWVEALVAGEPLPHVDFKKAVTNWLSDPANHKTLVDYWKIIGFIPLAQELIAANMNAGVFNPEAAEAVFRRYML